MEQKQENQKKVLVPLSNGFEEMEAVCIIDVLRRAEISVTVASILEKKQQDNSDNIIVKGSHDISILADTYFEDCIDLEYDLIALPGGLPGADILSNHKPLIDKLQQQIKAEKYVGAICASPYYILQKNQLTNQNTKITGHPSVQPQLFNKNHLQERVVYDKPFITSQSPGTAIEFALKIVETLCTPEKALQLAKAMVVKK